MRVGQWPRVVHAVASMSGKEAQAAASVGGKLCDCYRYPCLNPSSAQPPSTALLTLNFDHLDTYW